MTTIGAVAHGRDNNFNLIRMIAAMAVIVSHGWLLTEGEAGHEPLEQSLGVTLGVVGVYVFFAISGFLIARSFDRRADPVDFLAARFLRLFPALVAVLLLTAFVFGPLVSALPPAAYFSDPAPYAYVVRNVTLLVMQYQLPGVFEGLPYPGVVNGTLWSLFYEAACYGMVFALGLAGGLANRRLFVGFLVLYAVGFCAVEALRPHGLVQHHVGLFQRTSFPFVLGMALYVWRDRAALSWIAAAGLAAAAVAAHGGPAFPYLFMVALCYAVFTLAYLPGGALRRYNDLGDYSYGLYIYGFPVQQLMVQLFPAAGPLENVALSAPIALALAILSWVTIEKPSLAAKEVLGARLRALFARRRARRAIEPRCVAAFAEITIALFG